MIYYKFVRKLYQKAAKRMCLNCKDFIKNDSKILDLGCGSGIVGKEFENFFKARLRGVDIIDQRIEKIPFQLFDGKNVPFPENYFDYVLISYVLHHSKDPIYLLKEAKRVVKDKIIIYEDLAEGFWGRLFCKIHGLTFSFLFNKGKASSNFKNDKEWKKIFGDLKLKIVSEKIVSSKIYPVSQKLYILAKTKNKKGA